MEEYKAASVAWDVSCDSRETTPVSGHASHCSPRRLFLDVPLVKIPLRISLSPKRGVAKVKFSPVDKYR